MAVEFDTAKDALNVEKHGISLARAEDLFARAYAEIEDLRFEYGERRFVAYGLIDGRLFACVFAWRGQNRRIISLRKAN